MREDQYEETRAIAHLPQLDIEIVHGRSPDGHAEHLSISLFAFPSFAAFGRGFEAANPFLFWMSLAQTAWAPWIGAFQTRLPQRPATKLPASPEDPGPM